MVRLLILLILLGSQVDAGAWPRKKREGFLSFSVTAYDPKPGGTSAGYASLYTEYGVRKDLTLGLDLGSSEFGDHKAIAFLVTPISKKGDTTKVSFELGIGITNGKFVIRPGLAFGKGFEFIGKNGWFSIETRSEILATNASSKLASDITLGLSASDSSKVILQLQSGGSLASPDFLRLAPSFVYEYLAGRHIELGATAGIKNADAFGLKLGIWRAF